MARKSREMVITLTLPPDLFKWVKARADTKALDPESWVRMTLKELSEGRQEPNRERYEQLLAWPSDASVRPPTAESDIDAIIGEVVETDPGFGPQAQPTAEVRPLHRPPTPFSPQNQPRHLAGL